MKQLYSPFQRLLRTLGISTYQISRLLKFAWLSWVLLLGAFFFQPLKAQDNNKTSRSLTTTTRWSFDLPPTQTVGPKRISVDFEFYFVREPLNKNYASLTMKVKGMSLGNEDGTPAFKYKGQVFTGNQLSAIDGLSNALTGFDEINITGIRFSVEVTGGSNPTRINVSNGNEGYVKVTGITDDTDLNSLNIGWASAVTTMISFNNHFSLQARIDKALRLTQNREQYKTVIREADAAFNAENLADAKVKYTEAGNLLPGEHYPQDQLRKINDILDQQKAQVSKEQPGTANPGTSAQTSESMGTNAKKTTGSSVSGDEDYWSTGTKTTTDQGRTGSEGKQAGISKDAPPMVVDNAGNFYVQDENGRYVKTDKANYDAVKKDYYAAKNRPGSEAYNTQKKQDEQAALKKFYDGQDDFIDDIKAKQAKSERDGQLLATSYYTAQAKSQAREGLQDLSRLDGSFESLEELNAAFYQQYAAIGDQQQQLSDASRDDVDARMDYAFKDADANTAAFKGLATTLGNLASDAAAEREAREARQMLKEEHERQARLIKEHKRQALLAMRGELLKKFPEGGVPLSSHKVPGNDLYFFAYVLAPEAINEERPTVKVSNVYLIQRYSDGAWPFKNAIVNELKKASGSAQDIVMVGYYTDKDQADQMHDAFVDIAGKSEMNVTSFDYKGKKSSGAAGSGDNEFWGGDAGNKPSPKTAPDNSKGTDDWWGSNNKPAEQAPE